MVSSRKVRSEFVSLGRQAGDANTGDAFVTNVQTDDQRGDLLNNTCILKLAAVKRAYAWNFASEGAHFRTCFFIVAADDYIAIDQPVVPQEFRCNIVKRSNDRNAFRRQFRRLLCD